MAFKSTNPGKVKTVKLSTEQKNPLLQSKGHKASSPLDFNADDNIYQAAGLGVILPSMTILQNSIVNLKSIVWNSAHSRVQISSK